MEVRLPKGAVVTGRVVDEYAGPLPILIVFAERVKGPFEFERTASAETDDTGAYRLFGLATGDYVIGVESSRWNIPPGRLLARDTKPYQYYPRATGAADADVLVLAPGSETNGIDFTLSLPATQPPAVTSRNSAVPAEASGVIRGHVLRSDGFPARGVPIQLSSVDQLLTPFGTVSNDEGLYEFVGVAPGRYRVAVDMNARFQTGVFGARSPRGMGEVINVTAGSVIESIDIGIRSGSLIVGRIVDEYGDPIERATVRAAGVRWTKGRYRFDEGTARQTDDLGRFRLWLPPGRYLVSADMSPGAPWWHINELPGYVRTYFSGTSLAREAQPVDIGDSQDALSVEFALLPGRSGRISGRVARANGQPFEGTVHLIASRRSGANAPLAWNGRAQTEDGAFTFADLEPGEYVIHAATSREGTSFEGEFGLQFVTVNGNEVSDVSIRLSSGSSVTGRISFDGASPPDVPDLELSAVPSDLDYVSLAGEPVGRAEIHDDWSFELHGVNGPRRLKLVHAPDGWMLKKIYLNGTDVTDAVLLFGTNDQSISDVEVVLTRANTELSGMVRDDRGRPSPDALVVAFATDPSLRYPNSRLVGSSDTSAEGSFRLYALPPGEYYLVAVDKRDAKVFVDNLNNPDLKENLDNPAFLLSLAPRAARIIIGDGQHLTATVQLSSR
jgi:hypothetical protein